MRIEEVDLVGDDLGKSRWKRAHLRARQRVDDLGTITKLDYRVLQTDLMPVPQPLNEESDVVGAIRDGTLNCRPDPARTRCALTFPLPADQSGRIIGRDGWRYFDGKTREQLKTDLQRAIGSPCLALPHDSEAQAVYIIWEYNPAGVFGVAAFGTSIAFTMRSPADPAVFANTSPTFSHMVLGGMAPGVLLAANAA
jgi:hypothetical protein